MIHVTWQPGCYGNYVMQSIYAYSNLSNGTDIHIESTGSSHGFNIRNKFFIYDHSCSPKADVIISANCRHQLDYANNQLVKFFYNDIHNYVERSFPNYSMDSNGLWPHGSRWATREWISFWLVDALENAYGTIEGHFDTVDLFDDNVFPALINRLGLTMAVDNATMKLNQARWVEQQRFHNSQQRCELWIQDIRYQLSSDSPCQTLLDEAYVQHRLRQQGYEIRCDGLDVFPTNSRDLRELIYENSHTNN